MANIEDMKLSDSDIFALLGHSNAQLELANRMVIALRAENAELKSQLDNKHEKK